MNICVFSKYHMVEKLGKFGKWAALCQAKICPNASIQYKLITNSPNFHLSKSYHGKICESFLSPNFPAICYLNVTIWLIHKMYQNKFYRDCLD